MLPSVKLAMESPHHCEEDEEEEEERHEEDRFVFSMDHHEDEEAKGSGRGGGGEDRFFLNLCTLFVATFAHKLLSLSSVKTRSGSNNLV